MSRVAIVLPPREGFGPGEAGSIGLIVHSLARHGAEFTATVIGSVQADAFADVAFRPARLSWLPGSYAARYTGGVLRALQGVYPDLIEVHNRPDLALAIARRHRDVPVTLFLNNDPIGMRKATSTEERNSLIASLARVVCTTEFLRGRLLIKVPSPARMPVVLPNPLDLSTIPRSPAEREAKILFAGRIVQDKGPDSFARACARALPQLPGWRAEMIGADRFGPSSPETPFLRAVRAEAAYAGVEMLGYRPHADVLAAMASAAIVMVPSRWAEPFGMTALEAMACGAALLCSPRGGLAEVIGQAAQRIDPDDPAAMANAIVALARDPARRAALGASGRLRAKLFDLPRVAASLDALRAEVLDTWSRGKRRPI